MNVVFNAAQHSYSVAGQRLPSVTQILRVAGITKDLSGIDPEVLDRARHRGVRVHALCERIDLKGDLDLGDEFATYAEQYQNWMRGASVTPIAVETPTYHPVEMYAGTPDLVAWVGTDRAIVDRKATFSMDHVGTRVQCAAYSLAWDAHHPTMPVTALYGLHLRRDGFTCTPYDLAVARQEWITALAIYRERTAPRKKTMLHVVKPKPAIVHTHPFLADNPPPDEEPFDLEAEAAADPEVLAETQVEVKVKREVSELTAQAEALDVVDEASAQLASDMINSCKAKKDGIKSWFEPLVSAAHGTWKKLVGRRDESLEKYDEPERILRTKLSAFYAEQERARKDAAEAAALKARQEAEAERARKVEAAREIGDEERAARIEAAPAPPVAIQAVDLVPEIKLKGASFVERWSAKVDDLGELVRAVASGAAPIELLQVNQTALNGLARSLKGGLNYPGVRVICEQQVRATGRR